MARGIPDWSAGLFTLHIQHPSMRVTVVAQSVTGAFAALPASGGCYVLLAIPQQTAYVGTATDLARRVPESVTQNLSRATHAVLLEPVGMAWTVDERLDLERRLIAGLPGAANWQRGTGCPRIMSPYLDEVATQALALIGLWLVRPPVDRGPGRAPSQATIARDLVLDEHRHPYTVAELLDRLRGLGWTAHGQTPHKTARRDLRCATRGGTDVIRVTGAWSDGDTHVYVQGRRYTSGWRPDPAQSGGVA
jgi:hypothetical protein